MTLLEKVIRETVLKHYVVPRFWRTRCKCGYQLKHPYRYMHADHLGIVIMEELRKPPRP